MNHGNRSENRLGKEVGERADGKVDGDREDR